MIDIVLGVAVILGSAIIGGSVTSAAGFCAGTLVEHMLLGWRMLSVVGAFIGGVMGVCSVAKMEGIGSYMTDQQVLGATVYRYRQKVVEENYFDYVFFFAGFALFLVNLWAYNPAFETSIFSSDVLCLALAFGGSSVSGFLVMRLSSWVEETEF